MSIEKRNIRGTLLAVEGVDGSGKTIFVNNFQKELDKHGISNAVFKNHNGIESPHWNSYVKTRIQLENRDQQISADAARAIQTSEFLMFARYVLPNLLLSNQVVVADRYIVAKRVDSRVSLDGKVGSAELMLDAATDINQPDLIFYLRVTAETAWERLAHRKNKDWKENLESLSKAIYYYDLIISETPQVVILDSESEQKSVQEKALKKFQHKFKYLFESKKNL